MKPIFLIGTLVFHLAVTSSNGFAASQATTDQAPAYNKIFRLLTYDAPETMDPQKSSRRVDQQLAQYIFDPLFTLRHGEPMPVLVEQYKWVKPTQWEFTLKQGVKFHDGSELTSKDVVATFTRAARLHNDAHSNIKNYTIKALSRYLFIIDTVKPNSELLWDLEDIRVISHTAEHANPEDFDNGQFLTGTGPYRLLRQQGFDKIELIAFPQYHRGQAFIRHLEIRNETDNQKRADAFLAGEADMIDKVPDKLLRLLPGQTNVSSQTSHLLYFMAPDVSHDQSPDIFDLQGNPLINNPLKDLRVRQAISKALNRDKLLRNIYGEHNGAQSAGQLVNNTTKVASPLLLADKQDINEARSLMREAGYSEGFQLILRDKHARHHWLEQIAAMLKPIGIIAKIETLPAAEFFNGIRNQAYSAPFFGYSTDGNLTNMLKQLPYTGEKHNTGGYSNPQLDKQIDYAMQQTLTVLKQRALRKAQDMVIQDLALIPLWFTSNNWAIRQGMVFNPTDQAYTETYYVSPETTILPELSEND